MIYMHHHPESGFLTLSREGKVSDYKPKATVNSVDDTNLETHMYTQHREVNVVKQLVVKLDRHARVEENHHLLLAILLDERVQNQESLISWAHQEG